MKVDGWVYSISVTSDERTAAIESYWNPIGTTLLVDTDTLKVNHRIDGSRAKFSSDDKLIIAATNERRDITIYQVPSSLIVTSIFD